MNLNMIWVQHDMNLTFDKKHSVIELMKQIGNESQAFTSETFLNVFLWLKKLLQKLTKT